MKKSCSLLLILLAVLLISCMNPVIAGSQQLYLEFRDSWQNTGNYQFLDFYYPELTDEGDIENIKAERKHIIGEVGDKLDSMSVEIVSITVLDKWIFEGQVFYDNPVEISSTIHFGEELNYSELAYVISDKEGKCWIAHSQIRKEIK